MFFFFFFVFFFLLLLLLLFLFQYNYLSAICLIPTTFFLICINIFIFPVVFWLPVIAADIGSIGNLKGGWVSTKCTCSFLIKLFFSNHDCYETSTT